MHRPALFLLPAALAACSTPLPAPRVDGVAPALLCDEDGAVTVEISGAGFGAVLTDVLADPSLSLPTVTLDRAGAADGTDDGVSRHLELLPSTGELRWVDAETLAFDASPAIGLVPGAWDLVVTNPDGQTAGLENALLVAPGPTVDGLEPAGVCVEAAGAPLRVIGTGYLVVAGVAPTVTIDGGYPLATVPVGCEPLPGDVDGEACVALDVLVDATHLPLGDVSVQVTNPEPVGCASSTPATLAVTLPPRLDSVDPTGTCAGGGRITLTGERFPESPTVTVGGVDAASVIRVDERTLDVELAADTPEGLDDIVVTGPDGCSAAATAAVDVVSSPDVFFVDPPALYTGLSVQVTAYIADVSASVDTVWITDETTGVATSLDFTWDPETPGRVSATVPTGLPAGEYRFGIAEADGCSADLDEALTLTDTLEVAVDALDPPFAWEWSYTPVQVVGPDPVPAGQVPFAETPRLYLTPAAGGTTAAAVQGVVYRSGALLSATVPAELAPGMYDVLVVNPDGAVGLLPSGLEVTDDPPPQVDSVSPASLSSTRDEPVTIHGRYFRDPTVAIECEEAGVVSTAAGVVTTSTYTSIDALLPSNGFTDAVCVVVVTNADGTTARWAAVSVRNPAANLFPWEAGTDMVEARRAPASVAGRTSSVSRWVYAIGGDDGASTGALASVERAPMGVYGDLGTWEVLPTTLPGARTLAGAAIVGDFVYVVGGDDGTGPTDGVWRAHILDPLQVPRLADLSIDDGGGLDGGDWVWQVAAIYDPGDASNPGGESLPSDPILVTLPDEGGLAVTLTWAPLDGAVGYRVYRSPTADTDGDTEWVGDTVDPTFLDAGAVPDPTRTPLPEGSLGAWATEPSLITARAAPCLTVATDPLPDPEVVYLYVAGGEDPDGNALDSVEVLPITIVSDDQQDVDPWERADITLSTARWGCGAYTVDDALHTVVAPGETWVYFAGGDSGRRAVGDTDAGRVGVGGQIEDWQVVDAMSPARSGFGVASASDYLYAFGGQNGDPSEGGVSAELEAGTLPVLRNWNSLGISLAVPRYLPGSAQESSVIVLLGGESDTAAATRSTDVTHY
jgi:hypothetical protein